MLSFLTMARNDNKISDIAGVMASDKCHKLKLSYRHSHVDRVTNYLFGLVKIVDVKYYY